MNTFFKKKLITPFIAALLVTISVGSTWMLSQDWQTSKLTTEDLYQQSVEDTMIAEKDELAPVVTITKDSDMVTWNEAGNKVLLLSWHKYPKSYEEGSDISLTYGEVWTFTDKEIIKWYQENKENVTDWDMRFRQLIGLPPDATYTHFTALWVSPEDVYRPAYSTDITESTLPLTFADNTDETYTTWFNGNIVNSYYEGAYPWTRLGYTYDWADNGTEYGLSEFLVAKDAAVSVEFTKTTEDFIAWLDAANEK